MECKEIINSISGAYMGVLIETLWNVKVILWIQ